MTYKPPTLEELRVRLEQELAAEPENRGDAGSWYSRQSWRASVLSIRVEIAKLEGADPGEVRRLKSELEEARYVGD